ncbi:MAG TPA: DUF362 domain-containing protein [Anaerolineae bacterium]|nr:DUF362 domain-containing protein [Anaerolineae bacterium]
MAIPDTVRGLYHLFADRKPGDLETRAPKPRKRAVWLEDGQPVVAKVLVSDGVKPAVGRCLDLLGGLDRAIHRGERVLVKPNFNSPDPYPGSTDLGFLRAVLELLKDTGAEIVVGESAGGLWRPTRNTVDKLGALDLLDEMGMEFIAFDAGETDWVEVPIEGEFLQRVTVPKVMYEADRLVYLPGMKTHNFARFTLSLKLSMGFVHPAERLAYHMSNLEQKVAEINLVWQPDLVIMDGRKAFVSGGPEKGELVEPGIILASGDMVAIDVEGLKVLQSYEADNRLGSNPYELPQIATALKHGLTAAGGSYKVVE